MCLNGSSYLVIERSLHLDQRLGTFCCQSYVTHLSLHCFRHALKTFLFQMQGHLAVSMDVFVTTYLLIVRLEILFYHYCY